MSSGEWLFRGAIDLATALIVAGIVIALVRAVRGPEMVDRVVAVDLITMLGISLVSLHAMRTGEPLLVDVVLSLAFVGFLATTAFARWIDASGRRTGPPGGER